MKKKLQLLLLCFLPFAMMAEEALESIDIIGEINYCTAQTLHLSVDSLEELSSIKWILPNGLEVISDILEIPDLTVDHSGEYKVEVITEGDISLTATVTVVVRPFALPDYILVTRDPIICKENKILLEAELSNTAPNIIKPQFIWYSDNTLEHEIARGPTYEVSPIESTSYYVTVQGDNFCENEPKKSQEVFVIVLRRAIMDDIEVEEAKICLGETVTLKAFLSEQSNISGALFTWYKDSKLLNKIDTGKDLIVTPDKTTTYYVTVKGSNACENVSETGKPVTVIVKPLAEAADIEAEDTIICLGQTVTLKATLSKDSEIENDNLEFNWYKDKDINLENHLFTGADYPVTPMVTTIYYVTVKGNKTCENVSETGKPVTVIVKPLAEAADIVVEGEDSTICKGEEIILTASSPNDDITHFNWYSDMGLTDLISTDVVYKDSPKVTTTYYVTAESESICENVSGTAKAVTVMVTDISTPTTNDPVQEFCDNTNPIIADIQVNETDVIWYNTAVGGLPLDPDTFLESGIYYAALKDSVAGCESTIRLSIVIDVKTNTPGETIGWDTTVCLSESVTYRTTSGMLDYQWTIDGGTITEGGTLIDNFITVIWDKVGAAFIEVSFINTENCDPEVTVPFSLIVQECSDLFITKVVDHTTPEVGETVSFTITVGNDGRSDFKAVTITEVLPSGYNFVKAITSTGWYDADNGIWSVSKLQSGATVSFIIFF